ncbi:MAG: Mur ligase family protein [Patescibacteria group bacterium]
MQLRDLKKVHLIGIKGTGMSGLALALAKLGIKVTGSDATDSFLLLDSADFRRASVTIYEQFDATNVPEDANAIIASSSHLTKNVEINKARKLKIPVLTYADVVGMLSEEFKSIAVCGSHGKTTTTNLLAHVLASSKLPMLALAGPTSEQVLSELWVKSLPFGKPFRSATARERDAFPAGNDGVFSEGHMASPLFVFEADEYQNKLKQYSPFGVILTNIELDHPDYFKTKESYRKVFEQFVKRIPKEGFLIYCADDADCRAVAAKAKCHTFSYGFSEGADYLIRAVQHADHGTPFALHHEGKAIGIFRSALMGQHNVLNAAAVVLASRELGIDEQRIQAGLLSFRGSPRRLEKISEDPLVYDDYGHHPTEIKATLHALRSTFQDKKIVAVFHPHTYSRTKKFLKEFGASFTDADHVIVLDIFESREVGKQTISSKDVVTEIQKHGIKAEYAPTFEDAAKLLKGKLNDKTLLLTIGAGDVWKIHKLIT